MVWDKIKKKKMTVAKDVWIQWTRMLWRGIRQMLLGLSSVFFSCFWVLWCSSVLHQCHLSLGSCFPRISILIANSHVCRFPSYHCCCKLQHLWCNGRSLYCNYYSSTSFVSGVETIDVYCFLYYFPSSGS